MSSFDFNESDLIFVRDWKDEDWKLFRYVGRTENGCYMCVSESSYQDFCNGGFYCQIFIQGRRAFDYEVDEYRKRRNLKLMNTGKGGIKR